jgi:hypothetical protein
MKSVLYERQQAPATFKSLINEVLRLVLCWFILVFFDVILIYSPSWTEHL